MASLSSASTIAEIEAAYMDNAGYAEDRSAAKARAFVTACRLLLLKRPTEAGSGTDRLVLSPDQISGQIRSAEDWLASNDTAANGPMGPRVTGASFQNWHR
jgi:hypothetical protein